MDTKPFSVLMSLYDKEKPEYLKQSLISIQNQVLKPEQLIIVYDGFINWALEEVVETFKSALPIEIVRIDRNVGLGDALNFGLKYCKHNIVARMDTDDICLPERFDKQINFMLKHHEIAVLGASIDEYDENMSEFIGTRKTKIKNDEIRNYAKVRSPFNHMTVVFRKDVILSVGGYQHHAFMEDYNLWLRVISQDYVVHNLEETLVRARTGVSMIRRRKGIKYIYSEVKLAQLKYKLHFQGFLEAILVFLFRVIPRLLPSVFLEMIYKTLRNHK